MKPFSSLLSSMKRCLVAVLLLAVLSDHSSAAEETPDILLGMTTALTGPTSELGTAMRDGVVAGLERINRAGGINGRQLKLFVLDDGYEPYRAAANMRTLLEEKQVLAIIGNVGTPTAIASVPIAVEQKTLFFAPFTGAGLLRRHPPERYVVNYRASYEQEIEAMVEALIEQGGLAPTDIAFFTQRDGYGDAGYVSGYRALKRRGFKNDRQILHVRYERNTLAVENALADILYYRHPPKAVIMVGAYAPCAKFIQLAKESGLKALFLNVSFVGSKPLQRKLGPYADNVIITQVVPPLTGSRPPVADEFIADLEKIRSKTDPNDVSLEGYMAARILGKALQKAPSSLTREAVIDSLESLGSFNLGPGIPLKLSRQRHQASDGVWPTRLTAQDVLPFSWTEIGPLLREVTSP